MKTSQVCLKTLPLMILILLAGCAGPRQLMPTPNLYSGPEAPPLFSDLPAELQGNELDLLYVTDRTPETDEEGNFGYGYGRSLSTAFGSAIVSIEPAMSWAELERASLQKKRDTKLTLKLTSVEELGRFGETPPPVVLIDGEPQLDPATLQESREAQEMFHQEIQRRLALSPSKEVVMFVHGFNNDFDDAAFTLAEMWHYLGREQVPLLYTWPAGRGGPSGYIYDRESGEFTVYHLKRLIRDLSAMPEIRSFHLIAHSRGTDVLSSAVRELALVARASNEELPDEFRDSHIILAAPDMDMDVVSQRIVAEQLGRESKNITIYTSESDKALGIAERFFKSMKRIGRLEAADLDPEYLRSIGYMEGISFVSLESTESPEASHSYFHSDPYASSDLILTIRYGKEPGAENGRPLMPVASGFWKIEPGYPHQEAAPKQP